MEIKTFTTHANGMDFYCEMMGQGPTIVLVPDGSNDCGPYEKMMEYLADEFILKMLALSTFNQSLRCLQKLLILRQFQQLRWTPSWLTAANQTTAARGNRSVTWINSSHSPHLTMPEEMAQIVREKVKQYMRS